MSVDSVPADVSGQMDFKAGDKDVAENAREKHATVSYMMDEPDELPAKLYEGDGFSIYVPDEWDIIDDALVGCQTLSV